MQNLMGYEFEVSGGTAGYLRDADHVLTTTATLSDEDAAGIYFRVRPDAAKVGEIVGLVDAEGVRAGVVHSIVPVRHDPFTYDIVNIELR